VSRYGNKHPLLSVPRVANLFEHVLDRALYVSREVQQSCDGLVGVDDRLKQNTYKWKTLQEVYLAAMAETKANDTTTKRKMLPLSLFVAYSQASDDLRFMTQVVRYCRQQVEKGLAGRNVKEWRVSEDKEGTPPQSAVCFV
jgi:hypothetical protein